MSQVKAFLDVLFPELKGEFIEIRKMAPACTKGILVARGFFSSKEQLIESSISLSKVVDRDIYIGVCPRNNNQSGKKEDVSRGWVLWVDMDGKDFPNGKEGANERLSAFSLRPTMVVDSGHGYHAYWALKEPVSDASIFEKYLKQLASYLGGDEQVCSINEILRLPDTFNRKDANNPVPVQIVFQESNSYSLNEFDFVLKKGSKKKYSITASVMRLIESEDITLFHDEYSTPFATLPDAKSIAIPVGSKLFQNWIKRLAWRNLQEVLNNDTLQKIIGYLEAKALYDSPQEKLNVRVARTSEGLFYSIGDGRIVHITVNGWEVIKDSPVFFTHLRHQRQQVSPVPGGDLHELLNFIHLPKDEGERKDIGLLLMVWTVAAFISDFPHPILVVHGPHGAAKSTLCRIAKTLVDPSMLELAHPPTDEADFAITCSKHLVVPIDNMTTLQMWLSNALCRAVTGAGFSKRQLYTDSDEMILNFKRVIALNGINLVVDKADLLSRSLFIELEEVSPTERLSEDEFWSSFNEASRRILGAIFTTLSKALSEYPKVSIKEKPRMADFTNWGVAIARALGYKDEDFLRAFFENIENQDDFAIEASTVAQILLEFLKDKPLGTYVYQPTELHKQLTQVAQRMGHATRGEWPSSPSWLYKKLNEVKSNLQKKGVAIGKDKKKNRAITITKSRHFAVDAVRPVSAEDKSSEEVSA